MTIKHLYPNARPSLDLKFAKDKVLDPRITYSRSSTGTYFDSTGTLQSAATNQARFDHDPTTGESLGLLVEEARTNSVTYSNFQSGWSTTELTVVPNAAVAPDGTMTATKLIPTTATDWHFIQKNSTLTSSQRCVSVFVKAAEISEVYVGIYAYIGQGGVFDLTSGTTSSTGATITPYPNGWYRVSYQVSYGGRYSLVIHPGTRTNTVAGNGVDGIYVWGAQYEDGASFPTSYIPTTSSTVTRAADVAEVRGADWLNTWSTTGSGNSIYAEGSINYTTSVPFPGGPLLYTMDGFASINKIWYSYLEANRGPIDGTGGGFGAVELFHSAVTSRGPGTFKSCMTFDVPNNRLQSAWNTVLSGSASNAAYFNNMWTAGSNPRLTIGGKSIGSNRHAWCGCVKRISIYNVGFLDTTLQNLTS